MPAVKAMAYTGRAAVGEGAGGRVRIVVYRASMLARYPVHQYAKCLGRLLAATVEKRDGVSSTATGMDHEALLVYRS